MKIKDIRHVKTNETRTDGRYPLRIGSTVDFYLGMKPSVGNVMWLSYIFDNKGNTKEGVLKTSLVTNITETDVNFIVETINSVYYLEK